MKTDSPPEQPNRTVVKGFYSSESQEKGGESDKYSIADIELSPITETVKASENTVKSGETIDLNAVKEDGTLFQVIYDLDKTVATHKREVNETTENQIQQQRKERISWLKKAIGTRKSKIARGEGDAANHQKSIDEYEKELKKLLSS